MTGPIRRGHVSNRIRVLREAAGMTQAELAERVNASRQTVIAIEAEKYAPSLELAFRLARCLKAPFEEVFRYAD